MPQSRKTFEEIQNIIDKIEFMDWKLRLLSKGDGYLLQWVFNELDVEHPEKGPQPQHCRKWYLSPFSTETEIVETAWKACWIAMMHEVSERFSYNSKRIYSPHFAVSARIDMCNREVYDVRED